MKKIFNFIFAKQKKKKDQNGQLKYMSQRESAV